jgi:hypothetical protein
MQIPSLARETAEILWRRETGSTPSPRITPLSLTAAQSSFSSALCILA